jgi:DNA mismatch repair protein MutS
MAHVDGSSPTPGSPEQSSPRKSSTSGASLSVLFERPDDGIGVDELRQPDCFVDLNLDQLVASLCAGREQYNLAPLFYAPLHRVGAAHFRHSVLRDLEKPGIRAAVEDAATAMRRMREQLEQIEKLRYPAQAQAWFLAAAATYRTAVVALSCALDAGDIDSDGLRALREYLGTYTSSPAFTALSADIDTTTANLVGLRYAVHINSPHVTVTDYDNAPDYTLEIEQTFARFRQGAARSYLKQRYEMLPMNHVEEQILDRVARLQPEPFAALTAFCDRHRDFRDATVERFDREVQFYLAYLTLVLRLRDAGLPFCYPHVSARNKQLAVTDTFDIALANKLTSENTPVVCNDFHLNDPERIFIVSGPNNGGKTTFARTFGQLHYLASLGLLVPGRDARLFLPDRIYTHFEREEDVATLRGKLEDELVRVHDILEHATAASVIVMNESFNSTTLDDARFLGTVVLRQILDLGALALYVTFVDELATVSDATVSMVSTVVAENPAQRTFKIVRRPADGLAYAWAIAEKYGLTYERLMERVGQ